MCSEFLFLHSCEIIFNKSISYLQVPLVKCIIYTLGAHMYWMCSISNDLRVYRNVRYSCEICHDSYNCDFVSHSFQSYCNCYCWYVKIHSIGSLKKASNWGKKEHLYRYTNNMASFEWEYGCKKQFVMMWFSIFSSHLLQMHISSNKCLYRTCGLCGLKFFELL